MSESHEVEATPVQESSPRWQELAREAARAVSSPGAGELLRELLGLRLAGASYAIPVERVREIVRLRPITPVPRVPAAVLGVIALRGEIVQVIDLRRRLGLQAPEPTAKSRIVVLHGEDDRAAGMLVDGVREVLRVEERQLRPAAAAEGGAVTELVVRDGDFVSILDIDRVLDFDGDD